MIIRKDDGSFEQTTPASTWSFNVPESRTAINVIGAYSMDKRTKYDVDGEPTYEDGVLTVHFGIDSHIGVLLYSYEIEVGDGETTVEGSGGVIHVTQNNYPKE